MREAKSGKRTWNHRRAHGGILRNTRAGRRARPLSSRNPIHLVLKARRECLPGGFRTPRRFKLVHEVCDRYCRRFFIKIEKMSLQGDHIHFLIRPSRRSGVQNFLRVVAGQIAQRLENENLMKLEFHRRGERSAIEKVRLWMHRPFTRLVWGRRDYRTVMDYIQLNEKEAQGIISYRKERLRGLKAEEWKILWSRSPIHGKTCRNPLLLHIGFDNLRVK